MHENVTAAVKLLLRFGAILLTAQILQKLVIVLVECSVYAWNLYHEECLSMAFVLCCIGADYLDGIIFKGPSVIDTVISKLRGQ
jgi:hypothetical protein